MFITFRITIHLFDSFHYIAVHLLHSNLTACSHDIFRNSKVRLGVFSCLCHSSEFRFFLLFLSFSLSLVLSLSPSLALSPSPIMPFTEVKWYWFCCNQQKAFFISTFVWFFTVTCLVNIQFSVAICCLLCHMKISTSIKFRHGFPLLQINLINAAERRCWTAATAAGAAIMPEVTIINIWLWMRKITQIWLLVLFGYCSEEFVWIWCVFWPLKWGYNKSALDVSVICLLVL